MNYARVSRLERDPECKPKQTVPLILGKTAAVGAADHHKSRIADVAVGRVEVRRVRKIEDFRSELRFEALRQREFLEHAGVETDDSRRGEDAPIQIAEISERARAARYYGKGRLDVPLVRIADLGHIRIHQVSRECARETRAVA